MNQIPSKGRGWYDCYVYDDIVMIYKIEGQYVRLSRLGTPRELEKEWQKFLEKYVKQT